MRTKNWHKVHPERGLLSSAKKRARYEGLPFDLELSDISIPDICPVLGIPLLVKEGKRTNNTPSLDKIIRDKGYVKGNVQVISWRANRLKCDASLAELENICKYIRDNS